MQYLFQILASEKRTEKRPCLDRLIFFLGSPLVIKNRGTRPTVFHWQDYYVHLSLEGLRANTRTFLHAVCLGFVYEMLMVCELPGIPDMVQPNKYAGGVFVHFPVCCDSHFHEAKGKVLKYLNFMLLKILIN